MNFSVDFPIAFPCRVTVQYPSDMRQYYPSSYVHKIESRGLVEGQLTADPLGPLLSQSGFTSAYMNSTNCGFNPFQLPQTNPIFYNSWIMPMSNKAWVKDSESFAIAV